MFIIYIYIYIYIYVYELLRYIPLLKGFGVSGFAREGSEAADPSLESGVVLSSLWF